MENSDLNDTRTKENYYFKKNDHNGKTLAIIGLILELISLSLTCYNLKHVNLMTDSHRMIMWMIILASWGTGRVFQIKSKKEDYKGKILNLSFFCFVIQSACSILIIFGMLIYCLDFEYWDPIYTWMGWDEISVYSGNHVYGYPSQVLHNMYLLLITIIIITSTQLLFTIRRQDKIKNKTDSKQIMLWFSVIMPALTGIMFAFFMYTRVSNQTFEFANLCKEIKYYPIGSGFGSTKARIYNYAFTSKIYIILSISFALSYVLVILAGKFKKIPVKIISSILAGVILANGVVTFIGTLKAETYWNDDVSEYYLGSTIDEYFHN